MLSFCFAEFTPEYSHASGWRDQGSEIYRAHMHKKHKHIFDSSWCRDVCDSVQTWDWTNYRQLPGDILHRAQRILKDNTLLSHDKKYRSICFCSTGLQSSIGAVRLYLFFPFYLSQVRFLWRDELFIGVFFCVLHAQPCVVKWCQLQYYILLN